jgi:superfamily II DNA or RNA helicase
VREGKKFGIDATYERSDSKSSKIVVTNYEMLENFSASDFKGIVLDESSILKSYSGTMRNLIINTFGATDFRLACTATPAPNDFMELGNHSEFLGALKRVEMLSTFFVHDGGDTSKWRLKRHARQDFWKWICSWAVMARKPSDLGFTDDRFILPDLNIHDIAVDVHKPSNGRLFSLPAVTLEERRKARQESVSERTEKVAEIAAQKPNDAWLIWCNLNTESEAAAKAIPDAVELRGSDDRDDKAAKMLDFASGNIRVLVTKPSIAGFGMNWQHCSNVQFLGLSDSYEQFYQAIRRCWRFGQAKAVNCYVVTANNEGAVTENIKRKERDATKLAEGMIRACQKVA